MKNSSFVCVLCVFCLIGHLFLSDNLVLSISGIEGITLSQFVNELLENISILKKSGFKLISWYFVDCVVDLTVLLMRPSSNLLKNCKVPETNLDDEFTLFQAEKKWVQGKILFLTKRSIDFVCTQLFLQN